VQSWERYLRKQASVLVDVLEILGFLLFEIGFQRRGSLFCSLDRSWPRLGVGDGDAGGVEGRDPQQGNRGIENLNYGNLCSRNHNLHK
jgi:hypothetical protein